MPTARASRPRHRQAVRAGALLAVLLAVSAAAAQPMRDLAEAALDQRVTEPIEIKEQPIRDALRVLEQRTGLRFRVDPQAVDWLPAGEQTRIAITIKDNVSVREALKRIFAGLGLEMHVADDVVEVRPAPVLDRLGRRLTIEEVGLLQRLAAQPWQELDPSVPVEFDLPQQPDLDPRQALGVQMPPASTGTALAQFDVLMSRMRWEWVPQGNAVLIYSQSENIARRLDRPLNVAYQRMPLDQLLVDLGQRIGVLFRFEPGALASVSAREREVDLIQRNITARQVLELICGNTGLWYDITEDSVVLSAPPESTGPDTPRPRVVAILHMPLPDGTTFDILLREDQLPPEYHDLIDRVIEQKMPQVINLLKEQAGS